MTKVSLNDLVNLENQTSAVNIINANNAVIEAAFDNTLSRDGTSPNTMSANLDMNSFQIVNLPAPANNTSPLRVQDALSGISTTVAATGTSGHVVPFLDTSNTWSTNQTFNAGVIVAGNVEAGGHVSGSEINGNTYQIAGSTILTGSTTELTSPSNLTTCNTSAIPAGGITGKGLKFSNIPNFGVFFGSGVPGLAATKGSLYLRVDGFSTSTRMYVNIDGGTGWTNVVTGT